MIENWTRATLLHALLASVMALAATTSTARADPAPEAGRYEILEKAEDIRRHASDATSLTNAYAGQYCGSAKGGTPQATPDGRGAFLPLYNVNVNQVTCAIYWSPGTGAHAIWGANFDRFARDGYETVYGYPILDSEFMEDRSLMQIFSKLDEHGRPAPELYTTLVSSSLGAFPLRGPFAEEWWRTQGEMGAPTSDARPNFGTHVCHPNLLRGCTSGEQGTTQFDEYQAFQRWNANTRTYQLTCVCVAYDKWSIDPPTVRVARL